MNASVEERLARLERRMAKLETGHATVRLAARRAYARAHGVLPTDPNYPSDAEASGEPRRCRTVEAWEDQPRPQNDFGRGVYSARGPWRPTNPEDAGDGA